jgi:dsRNA-specific ribonuclease
MSENFASLIEEALERGDQGEIVLSDADRNTLATASQIDMSPSENTLSGLRSSLGSDKSVARIKREFALIHGDKYTWLTAGIDETNREQAREALLGAEVADQEIEALRRAKRDLADTENFQRFREVERHFDTLQQKSGGKVDILNRTTAIIESLQAARKGGDTKDLESNIRTLLEGIQ